MIKCLNCEKEIEPKRASRKYCSDSCRVLYNRKHGKKEAVSKFQMQVLYNEVLSMVKDLNKPTNEIKSFEPPKTNYPINTMQQPVMNQEGVYMQELRASTVITQIQQIIKAAKSNIMLSTPAKIRIEKYGIELSKNMYTD